MYIEDRLFSENTEETLYSILLDEDEYALYSEFQKEFGLAQRVGEAVKKRISKIGNKLKNRKAIAEAKEAEISDVEKIMRVADKIKPKSVKGINRNKELKKEKLLESLPPFYKSAREMVADDPQLRALMTAVQTNTARKMSRL